MLVEAYRANILYKITEIRTTYIFCFCFYAKSVFFFRVRSTYSIEKVLDTDNDPRSEIRDPRSRPRVIRPRFSAPGPPPGPPDNIERTNLMYSGEPMRSIGGHPGTSGTPDDIERTNLMYSGEPLRPIWGHPTTSESFVPLRGHFVCTVDGLPRYFSKSFHRRKLSENIVILFKVLDISHLERPGARSFISRTAGCEIIYISGGRVRDTQDISEREYRRLWLAAMKGFPSGTWVKDSLRGSRRLSF